MVEVPAATGVITPVESIIVALVSSNDFHFPPTSPVDVNVVVPLEQTPCVPLMVPAFGAVVTVNTTSFEGKLPFITTL